MDSGKVDNCITNKFEHFDVVQDVAPDHHYLKRESHNYVIKTIMKEWEILRKNLPQSIFVQVYETRIDLLRAAIIGPHKTPYHDGLFFFDIYLPSDYPNKPPEVYFHSHRHRLNPNLYADGKLCLSLINTWSGMDSERWRKIESTILQLLVSIQGLVLNEKPFFNEPAYESYRNILEPQWLRHSRVYNENVFLLSCKIMLQILRTPPRGFNSLVYEHFKERSASILAAMKAYENGVVVGQFQLNSSTFSIFQASGAFTSSLKKMAEELQKAFENIQEGEIKKSSKKRAIRSNENEKDKSEKKAKQLKFERTSSNEIITVNPKEHKSNSLWEMFLGYFKSSSKKKIN